MSIWIFVVLIFVSFLSFLLYFADLDHRSPIWPLLTSIIVFCLSVIHAIGFVIGGQEVTTSTEKSSCTQQLARLTTTEGCEYYLVQNGRKFQFSYIDKTDGLITEETEVENGKVHYDTDKDEITVVISETIKTHHTQWLFVVGDDKKETLYKYDFYIPSRDEIYNTYKK